MSLEPIPDQPPYYDDPEALDPPTLFGPTLVGGVPGDPLALAGEWALIRYMGNPIGELLFLSQSGLTLGRARENQLCLSEAEVSRYHARLDLVTQGELPPRVVLSDLGSTNGTFVNGRLIGASNGPQRLQHGDVIRVGVHAFKLKHLDDMERSYHEAVLAQTSEDHLTGLGNRASVLGFLSKHTDLSRRHRRPLSLILCDLDHFKSVNDDHGHAVGDCVLKSFGRVVSDRLRASDHVGRIGGEEFLLVLPETRGLEAQTVAEELRKAIASEPFVFLDDRPPFHVTCCFGVVQLQEDDPDGGTLLARADLALYRAKALGRNRVEFDGLP